MYDESRQLLLDPFHVDAVEIQGPIIAQTTDTSNLIPNPNLADVWILTDGG